ncbi:SPFH/Band 7/PHB domain protein, partial [Nocardia salmonicida]
LSAEGERQSRILRAQGERAASYLQAQGQAKAIEKVFAAIKNGKPTPELLAYQYMQTLPMVAKGDANKVWLVPSDFGKALEGFAQNFATKGEDGVFRYEPSTDEAPVKIEDDTDVADWFETASDPKIAEAVRAAEATARTPVEGFDTPVARPKTSVAKSADPELPTPPPIVPQEQPAPRPDDPYGRPWQPPHHG